MEHFARIQAWPGGPTGEGMWLNSLYPAGLLVVLMGRMTLSEDDLIYTG
jgi:hypothetical protein